MNNGIPYFIKYYNDIHILQKVQLIHQQLEKIQFPFVIPIESIKEDAIVQRWFDNSRTANYESIGDRKQVFELVQLLHETNQEIDWSVYQQIPTISLKAKWRHRIKNFQSVLKNHSFIEQQVGELIMSDAISIYKKLEIDKEGLQTLCHGDVVHHNFMKTEDGWKIIDFDLAYRGNPENEMLHWIMRVLPFMRYDLQQLLEEFPTLQKLQHKLSYVTFPNEVMREAIHYGRLSAYEQRKFRPFFQRFLQHALTHRNQLKKDAYQFERK